MGRAYGITTTMSASTSTTSRLGTVSPCQALGRDRPKQHVLWPLSVIGGNKRKDQQKIKNCEHRHNRQHGGARKTRTGEIRPFRTVNGLWHCGTTQNLLWHVLYSPLRRRSDPVAEVPDPRSRSVWRRLPRRCR